MLIKHWERNTCRLCSSSDIQLAIPLNPVPVGEKYYNNRPETEDPRFPINIYQCSKCKGVQTIDCIDSNYLWSNYTYFSGQNNGIIKHQKEVAKYIANRFNFDESPVVIDIGSNDGTLLHAFKRIGFNVFGIDPAETVAKVAIKAGIETHIGLFSDRSVKKLPSRYKNADLITAFNVFAHSDDMQGMINGVNLLLKEKGIFCFEVQYLKSILDKNLLGTIFHEHMIHYSVTSAKEFLENNGLRLFDLMENNIQKGSIIFFACKEINDIPISQSVTFMLDLEKNEGYTDGFRFKKFNKFISDEKQKIIRLLSKYKKDKYTIAGYGAARSGPTLAIQLGLENIFEYLIDDHPAKVGKYSAFEGLHVKDSIELIHSKPDIVIILAWIHAKSIVKHHIAFLENGGKFVILWPNIKEIHAGNYREWLENNSIKH